MRAAIGIVVLGLVLGGSGCLSPHGTARRILQTPGSTIHSLVLAKTIAWETRDFETYAENFENRVNAGEKISPAEYDDFVRAERMHWHVFRKTSE